MKTFRLIFLSSLIFFFFILSAHAVDVKFSGEFYAGGLYLDKTSFRQDDDPSTAFYFQRLRLNTTFFIAPGLMFSTRSDIMERSWGASRAYPSEEPDTLSAGTRTENENIAFDHAHLIYVSPVGIFNVGYSTIRAFGTTFGDNSIPAGNLTYIVQKNGFTGAVSVSQLREMSKTATYASTGTDRDDVDYMMFGKYEWKGGEAGILLDYERIATHRDLGLPAPLTGAGYLSRGCALNPYAKMQLGPVALQTELIYMFGKVLDWEGPSLGQPDMEIDQLAGWLDATAGFGRFYAGGTIAYVSGDDPGTADKMEGGIISGGIDWNPCLILFNNDLTYWTGGQSGHNDSANAGPLSNAWLFQLRGGVKPNDTLDMMVSVSYAHADEKPSPGWIDKSYGWEIDVIGQYKITGNLTYTLGGAYLFTGKYFKGISDENEIGNNYMLLNKLTLSF